MRRLILLILLICYCIPLPSAPLTGEEKGKTEVSSEYYDGLEQYSTSELMKTGEKYLADRSTHVRAFAAFSIVINRYYQGNPGTTPDISDVVEAMHHVGTLYLVSFFEYDMAYKYLSMAQQLAQENGVTEWLPYTYINLANLWEINKMAFPASSYSGMSYVSQAWDVAFANKNEELLPVIAFDMAILSYAHETDSVFSVQMSEFLDYSFKEESINQEIAKDFVRGVKNWSANNHDASEKYILSSLHRVEHLLRRDKTSAGDDNDVRYGERQMLSILSALAELYIATGRNDDAIATLGEYALLTTANPDFLIDLYALYVKYYKAENIPDSVEKYHYLYLKGKEAVATDNKLYEVGEREFITRIEHVNEEVISLSGKNRIQHMQLKAAIVALLLLLCLIGVAIWAYVRLRNKSAQLYRKNVAMIEEQSLFHLREKQLQKEIEQLQSSSASLKPLKRSVISESDAEKLYSRLVEIMEGGGDMLEPDFSLERLAILAGSKPRTVSHVINLKYGSNFSQFLNEYRIREACLRFQNTVEYGNLTVEAIAESVGYRSRTGFSSLFKSATGLSPSEYHRQAKRASNMNNATHKGDQTP